MGSGSLKHNASKWNGVVTGTERAVGMCVAANLLWRKCYTSVNDLHGEMKLK